MFRFGNTLTPVRIIGYVTILLMLPLTGAATYDNNPIIASIGYAHAQSDEDSSGSPSSTDGNNDTETTSGSIGNSSTTTTNSSVLRGIIGSSLQAQQDQGVNSSSTDRQATATLGDDYVAAGRWRMVVENGTLDRFVAHFIVAKLDGSNNHDFVIENIGPASKFTDNATRLLMQISTDGSADPVTIVPITLELHGKMLRIADINVDEGKIDDPNQANTLRIVDGHTIYGMIESQEGG